MSMYFWVPEYTWPYIHILYIHAPMYERTWVSKYVCFCACMYACVLERERKREKRERERDEVSEKHRALIRPKITQRDHYHKHHPHIFCAKLLRLLDGSA